MKKTISLASFVLLLAAAAAAQGIDFFHGTWPEALAKAKAEKKLIFVDAYASWCGPCKRMSSQTFPDPKAGEFFNPNFICLKIDMEKPENAEFAGKYPVSAYPTLMFIDAEGKVAFKQVGAMGVDALLEFGQKALGGQDKSPEYEKKYQDGNREPEFLFEYVRALNRAGKPSLKITNEYLGTQKDLATPANLRFILEGAVEADSRVFGLLIKHRDKIVAQEGAEAVNARIELACKNTVRKAIEFKDPALLKEAKDKMAQARPERAETFASESDLKYYAVTKDVQQYLKAIRTYQKNTVKNNAAKMHDLVIDLVRTFPNEAKALDQAEEWAEKAAENGGLPEYYLTLADVYKRQGNKAKAREAAEKARHANNGADNNLGPKIDYFLENLD